jgi:hypothetical protein
MHLPTHLNARLRGHVRTCRNPHARRQGKGPGPEGDLTWRGAEQPCSPLESCPCIAHVGAAAAACVRSFSASVGSWRVPADAPHGVRLSARHPLWLTPLPLLPIVFMTRGQGAAMSRSVPSSGALLVACLAPSPSCPSSSAAAPTSALKGERGLP